MVSHHASIIIVIYHVFLKRQVNQSNTLRLEEEMRMINKNLPIINTKRFVWDDEKKSWCLVTGLSTFVCEFSLGSGLRWLILGIRLIKGRFVTN